MKSRPIPGSTGEVLHELPSPYQPHPATGLLHLPRFIAKIRYTRDHGQLPDSYRKNYKRGFDRFLCLHLGIEPNEVEAIVRDSDDDDDEIDRLLLALFPDNIRAVKWNRELVQKGMTDAGREFIRESLEAMGCLDWVNEIKSVADMIELDEGRLT
ncbi:DUF5069 domain-containing protein [Cerasicoccus arenae]|uniref:DUF5069 domain-containing protein n=1 Tax=Cerasicoccus arenae TaxID=424488 RepID=A0A8J3GDH0_9BACT|nr:DUF5069 domain-containing protein [Cerasicoccus arenae]MBK1857681.1 DUF5069 domain-containing protein [Cerasicoccus arenae]GHB91408.1 hypothetical protein GCM10007047_03110 [Cerasicoccus arenae]